MSDSKSLQTAGEYRESAPRYRDVFRSIALPLPIISPLQVQIVQDSIVGKYLCNCGVDLMRLHADRDFAPPTLLVGGYVIGWLFVWLVV